MALHHRQALTIAMDQRSIALLEFPTIRDRLAAATSFGPSRRLAEALEPSSEAVVVARTLDETDQALGLVQERPDVGIGGAHDIGPGIERAVRGGRLEPSDFLAIADTLDATAPGRCPRRRPPSVAARPGPRSPSTARASFDAGP